MTNNYNREEATCLNCGKTFYKLKRPKKHAIARPLRRSNCITCSHVCSETYHRNIARINNTGFVK